MPINTQNQGKNQAHSEQDQRYNGSITNPMDDHISVKQVRDALSGASFPANKDQLAEYAKEHNAPSHIVTVLQQMPTSEFGSPNAETQTTYNNLDELIQEIARVENLGEHYDGGRTPGPTGAPENTDKENRIRDTV